MKKYLMIFVAIAIAGCSNNSSKKDVGGSDSLTSVNQGAKSRNSDADTTITKIGTEPMGGESGSDLGRDLIARSDCNTCHKRDAKVIGPAFKDVASKYPASQANIEKLAKKVIAGGQGNWGDISMTPHPSLSESDAQEMVKYILSLEK
jgi:cytochrome c